MNERRKQTRNRYEIRNSYNVKIKIQQTECTLGNRKIPSEIQNQINDTEKELSYTRIVVYGGRRYVITEPPIKGRRNKRKKRYGK